MQSRNTYSRFWKIKHTNGTVSYLLGSNHVAHPEVSHLPLVVYNALKETNEIHCEMNLIGTFDTQNKAKVIEKILKSKTKENEINFSGYFTTNEKRRLFRFYEQCGYEPYFYQINQFSLRKMVYFLVFLYLGTTNPLNRKGMDFILWDKAQALKKKTYGLESETRIQMFDDYPTQELVEEAQFLLNNIIPYVRLIKIFKQIYHFIHPLNASVEYYLNGLVVKADNQPQENLLASAASIEIRNLNLYPALQKTLSSRSAFIVIGNNHLPGENGLVNLLKKSNEYELIPINTIDKDAPWKTVRRQVRPIMIAAALIFLPILFDHKNVRPEAQWAATILCFVLSALIWNGAWDRCSFTFKNNLFSKSPKLNDIEVVDETSDLMRYARP